jgi:hypothetical protein
MTDVPFVCSRSCCRNSVVDDNVNEGRLKQATLQTSVHDAARLGRKTTHGDTLE